MKWDELSEAAKARVKRAGFGFVVDLVVFVGMAWFIKSMTFGAVEKAMQTGGTNAWLAAGVEVLVGGFLLLQVPSLSAALSLAAVEKVTRKQGGVDEQ